MRTAELSYVWHVLRQTFLIDSKGFMLLWFAAPTILFPAFCPNLCISVTYRSESEVFPVGNSGGIAGHGWSLFITGRPIHIHQPHCPLNGSHIHLLKSAIVPIFFHVSQR